MTSWKRQGIRRANLDVDGDGIRTRTLPGTHANARRLTSARAHQEGRRHLLRGGAGLNVYNVRGC